MRERRRLIICCVLGGAIAAAMVFRLPQGTSIESLIAASSGVARATEPRLSGGWRWSPYRGPLAVEPKLADALGATLAAAHGQPTHASGVALLVGPALHNCNFGQAFSIWDVLFGTALHGEPVRPTGVGDPIIDADNERSLIEMQWHALKRFWGAFRRPSGWRPGDVSFGPRNEPMHDGLSVGLASETRV